MIMYFVLMSDTHKPIKSIELETYPNIPRVGEGVLIDGQDYCVIAVMHNIDLSEIKIILNP